MTSILQLFELLKLKLGIKESEALVSFIDVRIKENNAQNEKAFATKLEIADFKSDMKDIRTDIKDIRNDMSNLRISMNDQLNQLRVEIAKVNTDNKWVFAILIPMLLMIIGLYFKK